MSDLNFRLAGIEALRRMTKVSYDKKTFREDAANVAKFTAGAAGAGYIAGHFANGREGRRIGAALAGGSALLGAGGGTALGRYLEKKPKQKTAGPLDAAAQWVKAHPKEIAGAVLGAGAGMGTEYAFSRHAPGEKSKAQKITDEVLAKIEARKAEQQKKGETPSFSQDFSEASTRGVGGINDVMAKYPGKGSLRAAPIGALLGLRLARILT